MLLPVDSRNEIRPDGHVPYEKEPLVELKEIGGYDFFSYLQMSREEVSHNILEQVFGPIKSSGFHESSLSVNAIYSKESSYIEEVFRKFSLNQIAKIAVDVESYKKSIEDNCKLLGYKCNSETLSISLRQYLKMRIFEEKQSFSSERFEGIKNKNYAKHFLFDLFDSYNKERDTDAFLKNSKSCVRISGDLNGLKAINDCFSHRKGDDYLRFFSDAIKRAVKDLKLDSRLSSYEIDITAEGGDEFCLTIVDASGNDIPDKAIDLVIKEVSEHVEKDSILKKLMKENFDFSDDEVFQRMFSDQDLKKYEEYCTLRDNGGDVSLFDEKDLKSFKKMDYLRDSGDNRFEMDVKIAFGGISVGSFLEQQLDQLEKLRNQLINANEDEQLFVNALTKIRDKQKLNNKDIMSIMGFYFDQCDNLMMLRKDAMKDDIAANGLHGEVMSLLYSRNKDQATISNELDSLKEKLSRIKIISSSCGVCGKKIEGILTGFGEL